jgi:5'-nucleotidase
MRILVSNDDGVYAPGIVALAQALSQIGEVTVIAPDRNRSGASNSLTLDNPLRIKHLDNGFISVEGTPTDCVHLALTGGLLKQKPDIVVSGINAGSNLGDDVFYSGTVAAAMESRFLGIPAIAISLAIEGANTQHYATAGEVAKLLALHLQADRLPPKTILNVNVPNRPFNTLRGFSVTRLGTRHGAEQTTPAVDPRGNTIYWIGPPGPEQDAGPGTDFCAVNNGEVAVTPLQLDLTNYATFDRLAGWVDGLNKPV